MKRITMFCLPYAGGNKYSYRDYEKMAPPHVHVVPLEYPGRGSRIKEGFVLKMDVLVDRLYEDIKSRLDDDYMIYGHSMGGVAAFFLARKIIAAGHKPPMHLFITGTMGPSAPTRKIKKRHLLSKKEFIQEIKDLDGCPEEILQNEELLNYFEPILRADFQVSETYTYEPGPVFNIPITVITGTAEDMEQEEILLWQKESSLPVDFRTMPGKHFFIFKFPLEIMEIICSKLSIHQQAY